MSRTSEYLNVPIPSILPGWVPVQMVASVYWLSDGKVEGQYVEFISGPTLVSSPLINRKVFFCVEGTKPDEEATMQETIAIQGIPYDIYLATDNYNRQ